MLISIRRSPAPAEPPTDESVFDQMLACHPRIRRFLGLARRLGEEGDLPAPEVGDAAAAVVRYFDEALPLHAEDEDQSLGPRLLAAAVPPAVEQALARMTAEHARLEETLAEARPLWRALAAEPASRASLRGRLDTLARLLQARFEAHLLTEEALIFPWARRCLGEAEQRAIRAELQRRRETPKEREDPTR